MRRALIWVQSLLGIGHLRRATTIAEALLEEGFRVRLVNGGSGPAWPMPEGVEVIQLAPLRADGPQFRRLLDGEGREADEELWRARSEVLRAAAREFRPQVVIIEMFPFGRRAFRRELLPWLEELRGLGGGSPLVVCSVRDLLVSRARAVHERVVETVRRFFDLVLVHADPALVPFAASFPPARALADRIRYTGYVVARMPAPAARREGVLVSAGGGAVGARLLERAQQARKHSRLNAEPWSFAAGPRGEAGVAHAHRAEVQRVFPDFAARLASVRVSVSQAGYNTVVEALACRTPMVLVPFGTAREDEQARRARIMAGRGFAVHLEASELTPQRLAAAIDAAAEMRIAPRGIALDGARRTARLLREAVDVLG